MRIAFQTFTRPVWMAGMVTMQDLAIALGTLDTGRPELNLVTWANSDPHEYEILMPLMDGAITAKFPSSESVTPPRPLSPVERSNSASAAARRALAQRLVPAAPPPHALPTDETLRRSGVDCSFSVVFENRADLSVPLLIWIYDLQHRHLAELIPDTERERRDEVIARECGRASRLITQSTSVKQDLERFFPQARGKTQAITWVANVPAAVYDVAPGAVTSKYNLPEKFVYMPNQFWAHKNHRLVMEALVALRARNIAPVIVCTGSPHDHRNPQAFGELLRDLSLLDLRDQFLILGHIAREDVLPLMRQSIAVLNPSRFEGFGLSAAEATSLGKRALLSDLPSLREQAPPEAIYFDPNDASALADQLAYLWSECPPGPDLGMEHQARPALGGRQREFAQRFLNIAQEAIEAFRATAPNAAVQAVGHA